MKFSTVNGIVISYRKIIRKLIFENLHLTSGDFFEFKKLF